MAEKSKVQQELEEFRRTGIAYLSEEDKDLDFSGKANKDVSAKIKWEEWMDGGHSGMIGAEWNEDDHPRDDDGKFTFKEGDSKIDDNIPLAPEKESEILTLMDKAKQSADEIDNLGKEMAEKFKGVVTDINLKSQKSIRRKVRDELNGVVSQVKDAVRNTVVVDIETLYTVERILKQDPRFTDEQGGRVKLQADPEKFYGYTGVLTNIKTKSGILGEMQINTAAMIYAKEKKEDAIRVIGQKKYDEIAKKTGLPGGKGHEYYEKIRKLTPRVFKGEASNWEERYLARLKQYSIDYYSKFRF